MLPDLKTAEDITQPVPPPPPPSEFLDRTLKPTFPGSSLLSGLDYLLAPDEGQHRVALPLSLPQHPLEVLVVSVASQGLGHFIQFV